MLEVSAVNKAVEQLLTTAASLFIMLSVSLLYGEALNSVTSMRAEGLARLLSCRILDLVQEAYFELAAVNASSDVVLVAELSQVAPSYPEFRVRFFENGTIAVEVQGAEYASHVPIDGILLDSEASSEGRLYATFVGASPKFVLEG